MGPGSAMGTRAARTEPPSKDMRKASPRAAGRVMEKNGFPVPVLEVSWGGERGGPGSLRGHPGVWVWSRRTGSRCHPGSRCPAVAASRGVPERAGSIVTVTELSSLFVLFSFSRSEAHPARPRSSPLLPKQPKWLSGGGSYASPSSKLVPPGGRERLIFAGPSEPPGKPSSGLYRSSRLPSALAALRGRLVLLRRAAVRRLRWRA